MLMASLAGGQTLRFDAYRELQVPDKANLRLGPFYSDIAFSQSAGYRYVTSSGDGVGYLYGNERGRILKDGSDYPLVSRLSMRNYMLISKYADLDISFVLGYQHFPMETEENEFSFDVMGPGIFAHLGSFEYAEGDAAGRESRFNGRAEASAFMGESGASVSASISTDFELTPYVRGCLYDVPSYRTEYVDERGFGDNISGRKYTSFQNMLGLDMDWLMAKNKNLAYSGSRVDTIPEDDEFDIQRSVVYNQGVTYQQQLNPVAVGGVRANYVWRQYEESRGDQFQQDYATFLGADLSPDTRLQTAIGYSMGELTTDSEWETNGTSDTVIGMIRLSSRLTEHVTHDIGYEKSQRGGFSGGFEVLDSYSYGISWASPELSIGYRTAYQVVEPRLYRASDYSDWLHQVTVIKPLSQDLTLTLATAYTIRENSEPGEGEAGAGDRLVEESYDTWVSNIGLAYVLARDWTLHTYFEHLERFSDADDLAFTRDMAGISLTYARDL